jgi:hypothetical protein
MVPRSRQSPHVCVFQKADRLDYSRSVGIGFQNRQCFEFFPESPSAVNASRGATARDPILPQFSVLVGSRAATSGSCCRPPCG